MTKEENNKTEKIRLNLLLSQETKDLLEKLQVDTGASSSTEVIRNALRIYDDLVQMREQSKKQGGVLYTAIIKPDDNSIIDKARYNF